MSVVASIAGNEEAFRRATDPHRRSLHLHCYRLLGSFHDAEDALQETLTRAWRSRSSFEPVRPLGVWLHAIATNVCLSALARRNRRREEELAHLQPYPDALLDETPEARYEIRESVELAFVAAVQLLPAKQRAVLVLRDVLGWSAKEAAGALGDSVAAVNSALQRARVSLEHNRRSGAMAHIHSPPTDAAAQALIRRFMRAWDAVDIEGLASLLAEDAVMTMPPDPLRAVGRTAIGDFFSTVPMEGRLDEIRLVPTQANRQPALAAYARSPEDGIYRAYGVMVFALGESSIRSITGFPDASLFRHFGLPAELAS